MTNEPSKLASSHLTREEGANWLKREEDSGRSLHCSFWFSRSRRTGVGAKVGRCGGFKLELVLSVRGSRSESCATRKEPRYSLLSVATSEAPVPTSVRPAAGTSAGRRLHVRVDRFRIATTNGAWLWNTLRSRIRCAPFGIRSLLCAPSLRLIGVASRELTRRPCWPAADSSYRISILRSGASIVVDPDALRNGMRDGGGNHRPYQGGQLSSTAKRQQNKCRKNCAYGESQQFPA